jgi:thioredoxin reductase
MIPTYDIAIIGSGIAGMATALRLQAKDFQRLFSKHTGNPEAVPDTLSEKDFHLT